MTRLSDLSEAMAEGYTAIDDIGHVALVAAVFTDPSAAMIASARYIVDAGDAAACDGVDVADHLQGVGLAPILLIRLAGHAASSGIRRISSNTPLQRTQRSSCSPSKPSLLWCESAGTARSCTSCRECAAA
jgi:GNAT superfamily N-acetyltransferase